MTKNRLPRRLLAAILTVAMLAGLFPVSVFAAGKSGGGITVEKIDGMPRLMPLKSTENEKFIPTSEFADNDLVRVSIILNDASTIEAGYEAKNIAENKSAMKYRAALQYRQDRMAELISAEILGGEKLDVVWNLTLAADIISANVKYGRIDAIRKLKGVKDVVLETRYLPAVVGRDPDNPNMSTASEMTHGTMAWAAGYTGAGSRIAIVDTGLDLDHQSFDEKAFEYAIEETGKDVALMTEEDVAAVWDNLNIKDRLESASASDAYRTSKIPFAVNYVDSDLDVTHLNDKQEEHGSHVAGIAAANRYIPEEDGSFANALEKVLTQGEAPDAQLLVMKVFGKGGGAYDADYMAAVEDAIILGADVVNLSLGSSVAGFVRNSTYTEILDSLTECGLVWVNSAGNSYGFPQYTNFPYIYAEDANMATGGSPGTYANTLSVASADNTGYTGEYILVGDTMVFYTQTTDYGNAAISTIAGDYTYILIDGVGTEEEFAALKDVLTGNIAICSRGETSFFEKANAAVANGAVAVIIYNNQAGTIGMNLTGYVYNAPVVSVTMTDGAVLKDAAEQKKTADGAVYYEGTLSISENIGVNTAANTSNKMSDFSSWGVPGDLSLKPEITAPGGNIYSVNGAHAGGAAAHNKHDQYENMSGTSMAAPQIAGLTAVFAQYIRENDLLAKTGLTQRQLIQSLFMSTAEPMIDEESGSYYSVLQQGAGLANVEAAINATSYILMDDTATKSAQDGKIKVELGADEEREGTYTAKFTVNNMTDEEARYEFSADFFTQDIFPNYQMGVDNKPITDANGQPAFAYYLDSWTVPLEAKVNWTIDGEEYVPESNLKYDFDGDGQIGFTDVQALLDYVIGNRDMIYNEEYADLDEDSDIDTYDAYLVIAAINDASAVVKPNDSITVEVEFTLRDIEDYDINGAYIEGYLFVEEVESEDGAVGVTHSIPVLGYYGNWTESTMYDHGTYLDTTYGTGDLAPYMGNPYALGDQAGMVRSFTVKFAGESGSYYFGGNPILLDEVYLPERNAMNAADRLDGVRYTLIRNAAAGKIVVEDENGTELFLKDLGSDYAAYSYIDSQSGEPVWSNTTRKQSIGYTADGLNDGEKLTATVILAPEYYVEDDEVDWDALGEGAYYSISWTVDNTAPELVKIPDARILETGENYITVDVTDNQYIAAVVLFDEEGNMLDYYGADLDQAPGDTLTYDFDLNAIFGEEIQPHMLLQAYDYAANVVTYKINLNSDEELKDGIQGLTITPDQAVVIVGNQIRMSADAQPWGISDDVIWESFDESIATVDENGIVTGVAEGTTAIIATSVLDEDVSAYALVLVKQIDKELNGVVWDENSEVWFSGFNLKSLPEYEKLHDTSLKAPIAAVTYDGRGNLYAASFDTDSWTSDLYLVDQDTFELELVGGSDQIGYMDLAPAPNLGQNLLAAVYGPYVFLIDKETGDYLDVFDYTEELDGNYFVGIAYEYSEMHPQYGAPLDAYFLVDTAGELYNTAFITLGDETYDFGLMDTEVNFGYESDTPYFSSLYAVEDDMKLSLYWSRFNEEATDIIVFETEYYYDEEADDYYADSVICRAGGFEESVWPVGGLFELDNEQAVVLMQTRLKRTMMRSAPAASDSGKFEISAKTRVSESQVKEAAGTEAEPLKPVSVSTSKGTLNAIRVNEVTSDAPVKEEIQETEGTTIEIKASEATTNGKVTVEYESGAKLIDYQINADFESVIDEEGVFTFGYVNKEEIPADDVIATLTLDIDPEVIGVHYTTTVNERNEENPCKDDPETNVIGEHTWGDWIITKESTMIAEGSKYRVCEICGEVEKAVVEVDWTAVSEMFRLQQAARLREAARRAAEEKKPVVLPKQEWVNPFDDVFTSDSFFEDVKYVCENGIMNGVSDHEFAPNSTLTRAMIVTILYRMEKEPAVNFKGTFTDVDAGTWYSDSVEWAAENGVVNGYGDGKFGPNDPVTREQLAAILYRYAGKKGFDTSIDENTNYLSYNDVFEIADYAKLPMYWSIGNDMITETNGNLNPAVPARRSEVAAAIHAFLENAAK